MRKHLPSVSAIRGPSELPKTGDAVNVLHWSAYEKTPFEEVMEKKPGNSKKRKRKNWNRKIEMKSDLDGKEIFLRDEQRRIGTRSGDATWPGKGSASIRDQLG